MSIHPSDPPLELRTNKDGSISYTSLGKAKSTRKAILFVHGWGCRSFDWFAVIEALWQDKKRSDLPYAAVAVDLPGHGKSPKSKPSIRRFAEDLVGLLDELAFEEVVLVGHSMGVRVVTQLWHDLRERGHPFVRGLVYVEGSNYQLRPSLFAFDRNDPRSGSMTDQTRAKMKAEAFQKMFSEKTPQSFRDSTQAHVASRDKTYSEAIRDSMIAYDKEDMESKMKEFGSQHATKLLNLQSSDIGPDNHRVPIKPGDEETNKWMIRIRELVPDGKQVGIYESAHFPHVDYPEIVAKEIREFVEGLGF